MACGGHCFVIFLLLNDSSSPAQTIYQVLQAVECLFEKQDTFNKNGGFYRAFLNTSKIKALELILNTEHFTDAEFCKLGTRRLQVGNIVTNDCEDRCECLSTGELRCEPICKQYQKELQEGAGVKCHNETSPDGCCTYIECSQAPLLMGMPYS